MLLWIRFVESSPNGSSYCNIPRHLIAAPLALVALALGRGMCGRGFIKLEQTGLMVCCIIGVKILMLSVSAACTDVNIYRTSPALALHHLANELVANDALEPHVAL